MNGNPGFMANALQASSIILQSFRIHPSSFILAHWDEGLELRFQVTLASEELQPDRHGPERLAAKPVDAQFDQILMGGDDRRHVEPLGPTGEGLHVGPGVAMMVGKLAKGHGPIAALLKRVLEPLRIAYAAERGHRLPAERVE